MDLFKILSSQVEIWQIQKQKHTLVMPSASLFEASIAARIISSSISLLTDGGALGMKWFGPEVLLGILGSWADGMDGKSSSSSKTFDDKIPESSKVALLRTE